MKNLKLIAGLLIGAWLLSNCSSVPLTGRKRTAWLPESELSAMANDQYAQVIQQGPISSNTVMTNQVKGVGNRIARAATKYLTDNGYTDLLANFNWEFNLIESDQVNAWCMPGGKVAFYTGIMPICATDAGVAVVMGHEVAHAIAQHGNERMTHSLIQQAGAVSLAVAMQEQPQETQAMFFTAYGIGTELGGMLPFSRKHETEADELGLIFMAMAGYDPNEAPKFWERMATASGGEAPPEFLSTHPSHSNRIKHLNSLIPKAMEYYKPNQ